MHAMVEILFMCGSDDKAVISTLNIVSNWSEHGGRDSKRDEVRIFCCLPFLCSFFPCMLQILYFMYYFNVLIFSNRKLAKPWKVL